MIKRITNTLGSHETGEKIRSTKNYWKLEVLDSAFRFYVIDSDVEWFVEHDKLTGSEAYSGQKPWSVKSVLDLLEKRSEGYSHIEINSDLILIRKRMEDSPGLVISFKEKQIDFFEDTSLYRFNFLDFFNAGFQPGKKDYVFALSVKKEKNEEAYIN